MVALKGDLFDFGVINTVLDAVEAAGAHFAIVETSVTPLQPSTVLLQLTVEQGREALEEVTMARCKVLCAWPDCAQCMASISSQSACHLHPLIHPETA